MLSQSYFCGWLEFGTLKSMNNLLILLETHYNILGNLNTIAHIQPSFHFEMWMSKMELTCYKLKRATKSSWLNLTELSKNKNTSGTKWAKSFKDWKQYSITWSDKHFFEPTKFISHINANTKKTKLAVKKRHNKVFHKTKEIEKVTFWTLIGWKNKIRKGQKTCHFAEQS